MDINGPESGAAILTHSLFAWNCVQNDPHSLGRLGCRRDSFLAHSMPRWVSKKHWRIPKFQY